MVTEADRGSESRSAGAAVLAERDRPTPNQLRERPASYGLALAEHELVSLWLLGRVPEAVLPWPALRHGRSGRGPGPDIREAAFQHPSGVPLAGDIEVHLRASDFVRHGHLADPAYDGLVLHLVWEDDRPRPGTPTELPGGEFVVTIEVGPALNHDPARLRELVRRGPTGGEPCGDWAASVPPELTREAIRAEGRRRLAERAWGAGRLVEINGWAGAWDELLIRSLRASAGRRAAARVGRRAASPRCAGQRWPRWPRPAGAGAARPGTAAKRADRGAATARGTRSGAGDGDRLERGAPTAGSRGGGVRRPRPRRRNGGAGGRLAGTATVRADRGAEAVGRE